MHPEEAELIRAFRANWHEMVPHAYEDSVAIMESLIDGGHDVTMLTNFAADTFLRKPGRAFRSSTGRAGSPFPAKVKLLKPDRAIYELHASNFDLDPAATLFIDDSEKNVEGARTAGWQAVHFNGAEKLGKDLEALGVGAIPR